LKKHLVFIRNIYRWLFWTVTWHRI